MSNVLIERRSFGGLLTEIPTRPQPRAGSQNRIWQDKLDK